MLREVDYIKKGMCQFVESYCGIHKDTAHLTEASIYIVDTYFECIDDISFEQWIKQGNDNGMPYIFDEYTFKYEFESVFNTDLSLSKKVHIINELYFNGNLYWEYLDVGTNYFYTTQYKEELLHGVDNFNHVGCLMEAERLLTKMQIIDNLSDNDVQSSVEVINHYLNDYFTPSDYTGDNPMAFLVELNDLIGGIL